jgi:hypothetical protein
MICAKLIPGIVSIKLAQDEHRDNEVDLRKDKRALKVRS